MIQALSSRLSELPRLALTILALMIAASTACGGSEGNGGKLKVVTTVSPITSIVENIGGDRIQLEGVVPEGVNSHIFEPQPSLARLLSDADLIIANGLLLEEPTIELAEANKKDETPILLLGDQAITRDQWQFDFSFPESGGNPNPHLWPDPNLGLKYAELAERQLAQLDPDNAEYYEENLVAFRERIETMDAAIRTAVATIPAENRMLVTYHDSCSGLRELGVRDQPRRLLAGVAGLDLVEMPDAEVCCGFGGTFCVKYPGISGRMVSEKIENIAAAGADAVLAGDVGCLLNIAGRMSREGRTGRVFHVAEVLAGMAGRGIGEPAALGDGMPGTARARGSGRR